jgi:hypothetical protein
MMHVFLLFAMLCDTGNANCRPHNGGYYITQQTCIEAKKVLAAVVTDAQCKRVWMDPN